MDFVFQAGGNGRSKSIIVNINQEIIDFPRLLVPHSRNPVIKNNNMWNVY